MLDDREIDIAECRTFLAGEYSFDLLPALPPLLSYQDIAVALGISISSVQRMESLVIIQPIAVPGEAPVVPKSDIIDLIRVSFLANLPLDIPGNNTEESLK